MVPEDGVDLENCLRSRGYTEKLDPCEEHAAVKADDDV